MSEALLSIERLSVRFGPSTVVDDVSFSIAAGEKFALVGESGSGKSITALSVLRLVDAATTTGAIRFEGEDLCTKSERQMRGIRGGRIGMIFQEPMTALNPLYTVGNQIGEVLELHEAMRPNAARARAIELLARTGIPEPEKRIDVYPHQLSGGQRQRAMIAMALACRPKLLICDEPTTALDVTIQAQILALLDELQTEMGMALLFITHDLNLVRRFTHHVGVMERGRLVEVGATATVFGAPQHSYTKKLLASRPQRVVQPVPADAPLAIGETLLMATGTRALHPHVVQALRSDPPPYGYEHTSTTFSADGALLVITKRWRPSRCCRDEDAGPEPPHQVATLYASWPRTTASMLFGGALFCTAMWLSLIHISEPTRPY